MSVTLKHLRVFAAVATHGSFTQAAARLSLSQPALTIAVHQFEALLGVKLFDRTTRRVNLTAEGEELLPTAERLLDDVDRAVGDMRALAGRRRGKVAVAALPSVAVRFLPEVVARFNARFPAITVQLRDGNTREIGQQVTRGQVDFAIGGAIGAMPDLETEPLLSDRFHLVCRKDHPLARSHGPLAWVKLAGEEFLGLGPDTGIRPLLEAAPGLPEVILRPRYEVSNVITLAGLLEAGLGITALPKLAVPQSAQIVQRPLIDPLVEREICLIRRRERSLSPAAQSLIEIVRAVIVP